MSWHDTYEPPSTGPNGVYLDPKRDFSHIVANGEVISYRNVGVWWHRERGAAVRRQGHRIAEAINLPVYELRTDYRRSKPFRWEAL